MRKAIAVIFVLMLVGCNKDKPTGTTPPSATAAASSKPASTASAVASAAPSAAPSASGAVTEEPDEQEGLEKGEVIVGYLQDSRDEGKCAVLPAPAADKAKYDEKKLGEVATTMKSKVVPKCPTEGVVGTCKMMGMLVNYTGPKYSVDTAEKDCKKNR